LAAPFAQSVWPIWTNGPIMLFHGTTLASTHDIRGGGIDLAKCQNNTDFGRGFYTTTVERNAWKMAKKKVDRVGGQQAVVQLRLDRDQLGSLKTIAFVRGSVDAIDFWSFVYSCRNGLPFSAGPLGIYDVAYGPVALYWGGPENSRIYKGYDQISFHTQRAMEILNSKDICQVTIL
jgi:hypothetical protein